MRDMDENCDACSATRRPRAFFSAAVAVMLLASCTAEGTERASTPTPPPDTIRAMLATTQPPASTTNPNDEFIDLCVDYILLSSYLGDEESKSANKLLPRQSCESGTGNPSPMNSLRHSPLGAVVPTPSSVSVTNRGVTMKTHDPTPPPQHAAAPRPDLTPTLFTTTAR